VDWHRLIAQNKERDMNINASKAAQNLQRKNSVNVLCAIAVFAMLSVSAAQAALVSYTAVLKGTNEVPPNASTNTGRTRFVLDTTANTVTWVTKSSIPVASATGHHLHSGAVGVNGPVIVNFLGGGGYVGAGSVSAAQAANIVANPANFYVNLHTATFLGGEIRGPLVADPVTCTMDIDDDGQIDATTDGLLITRAMLGLTGTDVTNGAISTNALRSTWADIQSYLNSRCGTNFLP
jgi:CHRD domain